MLPTEQRFVLAASRVNCDARTVAEIKALLQEPFDWPSVLQLAIPHGTLPLITRNLRHIAPDRIPESLLWQLTHYAEGIRIRNEKARGELVRVIAGMRRRHIDPVPFRGPVLETSIYREPGLREYADMDLMVRREEVASAIEAIEAVGYRLSSRQQQRGLALCLRQGDALEFVQEGAVTIDLHWCFSNKSFDFRLDSESLRRDVESVEMGGLRVSVYDPRSTLAILCGHQAKHRWRRLNWLCDIAALVDTCGRMDWSSALKTARDAGGERIVLTTLELTRILLGVTLPDEVALRLRQDLRVGLLAQRLAPGILTSNMAGRMLYLQMREGNPIMVASRYLMAKLRHRLA